MKKILFMTLSDGLGGLELQMAQKTKDANELFGFGILLCLKYSKLSQHTEQSSIPFVEVNQRIPYLPLILILKLVRIINKNKIEIIVCGKSQELSIALVASKLSKTKPKVYFYQQMQSGLNKKDFFHNWIYRNIDGVIVISQFMVNQLLETTNIVKDKVELISIGIDIDKYYPLNDYKAEIRKKLHLPENDFLILYVARFDQHKDQLTLIKAFAEADLPDTHLILVGENTIGATDYLSICKNLVKEIKIEDKVLFYGFRTDLHLLFRASDLFVIPSRSETLGIVVLEAMASGLPVIGTNSGGIPDILENGSYGLLFEPRDNITLSILIKKIYLDKNKRIEFSKIGREKIEQNYNSKIQTQRFFEFISK